MRLTKTSAFLHYFSKFIGILLAKIMVSPSKVAKSCLTSVTKMKVHGNHGNGTLILTKALRKPIIRHRVELYTINVFFNVFCY